MAQRAPTTVDELTRAITNLTRASALHTRSILTRVYVFDPAAVMAGWAIGLWVNILDRNPNRVKLIVGRHSGAGIAYLNTEDPKSPPGAGPYPGIPINTANPPAFIDEFPVVHKGPWYMTTDTAGTKLYVIEFSLAQGQVT